MLLGRQTVLTYCPSKCCLPQLPRFVTDRQNAIHRLSSGCPLSHLLLTLGHRVEDDLLADPRVELADTAAVTLDGRVTLAPVVERQHAHHTFVTDEQTFLLCGDTPELLLTTGFLDTCIKMLPPVVTLPRVDGDQLVLCGLFVAGDSACYD